MRISDWSSDVCSADLLTVKPQLGILLPFALLASRQWTAIVVASVTAALLVGASALLFGWESWQAYAELVVPHQAVIMNERHGVFLVMMPSAYMALRLFEVEPLRSEEHTSELQSLMRISYAVFCLKKKKTNKITL